MDNIYETEYGLNNGLKILMAEGPIFIGMTYYSRVKGRYNVMLMYSFSYHVIIHFIVYSQLLFLRIRVDTSF